MATEIVAAYPLVCQSPMFRSASALTAAQTSQRRSLLYFWLSTPWEPPIFEARPIWAMPQTTMPNTTLFAASVASHHGQQPPGRGRFHQPHAVAFMRESSSPCLQTPGSNRGGSCDRWARIQRLHLDYSPHRASGDVPAARWRFHECGDRSPLSPEYSADADRWRKRPVAATVWLRRGTGAARCRDSPAGQGIGHRSI